jgi:nucleotidyltransferase AbiEii toxin of type IV toxin-antitoxin system
VIKRHQGDCTNPLGLTTFQVEVAQKFFALKEARGYLLAGGSALLAFGLISRPTQDLDFFTNDRSVTPARDAFLAAIQAQSGWSFSLVHDSNTFCRIEVCDGANQKLLVDLAVDSPPTDPPTMTVAGPAPTPIELGGRKLLALFGRAEARDFADVFMLSRTYSKAELLAKAAEIDAGFDKRVLAEMLGTLRRFADDEVPIDRSQLPELREFFAQWGRELLEDGE